MDNPFDKENNTLTKKYILSDAENTCKLKLHLPKKIINEIYKDLLLDIEVAGVIKCDEKDTVININKNKGNSDSVYTPNDVINFHTHPISAYNAGKTVWGWPSGEDIRETLKFALAGNKAHLVFTVEGLYTIQVSPCKLKKIKKMLNSTERGILIFLIEEYFKTTHAFRGVSEVNMLSKKETFITPYSFIDFTNNFELKNILSNKTIEFTEPVNETVDKIGHTGINSENNIGKYSVPEKFSKIPNVGFPEIDENSITNLPLKEFLSPDDLNDLRSIDESGKENTLNIKKIKEILDKIKTVFEKFETIDCKITWNNKKNAWFFINFFPSVYYKEGGYLKDKFITPNLETIKMQDLLKLDHDPFIRIFSNQKEGCSINKIGKINHFKVGPNKKLTQTTGFKMGCTICKQSSFGISTLTNQQSHIFYALLTNNLISKRRMNLVEFVNKLNQINKILGYPETNQQQILFELKNLKKYLTL